MQMYAHVHMCKCLKQMIDNFYNVVCPHYSHTVLVVVVVVVERTD